MREQARAPTCSCNLVYNFFIYLLPLKCSVFVVHFLNAFSHGNEAFTKDSSYNEVVCLLVTFHLPYSKCRGVKICSYQNQNYQIKIFHSYRTRIALVSLVSHACRIPVARVACVWHSCCKLD